MIYKSYLIEKNINIDKKLFLFFGENLGLISDFKKKIKYQNKESEIINFIQDELIIDTNKLFNEIANISLFEKEKIIFIEQVNDKVFEVIEEIVPRIENQKIYLFSNVLEKKSKIRNFFEKSNLCAAVACYQDNEITLKKIITEKLKGYEGLTTQNINLILSNVSLDRIKLNNELEKVATFFEDKIINYEKLQILLNISTNEDFNLLRDQALLGNKVKTNKLLGDTTIENDKIVFYLNIINQRLRRLSEVNAKKASDLENSINELKPPIFWKDKPNFILQAKKWSLSKIRKVQEKTFNLEVIIKANSLINKEFLIKKLILDICLLANS